MINIAALDDPITEPVGPDGFRWAGELCYDRDGLLVPPEYRNRGWYKITQKMREERSREWEILINQPKPVPKTFRVCAPRFTTDYAVKWGKRKGWKFLERERYDVRTKRHHDLLLGVDATFASDTGLVGVQGAGKHERAEHYKRFLARGGTELAQKLHVRVVYLEFVRGDINPIVTEWWAS